MGVDVVLKLGIPFLNLHRDRVTTVLLRIGMLVFLCSAVVPAANALSSAPNHNFARGVVLDWLERGNALFAAPNAHCDDILEMKSLCCNHHSHFTEMIPVRSGIATELPSLVMDCAEYLEIAGW